MRCVNRNKRKLYYALYEGKEELQDEYGNVTGSFHLTYSSPVEVYMNWSPSRGTADLEQFGIAVEYNHTIVTDDMDCPIDEHSILWIGVTPDEDGEDGAVKHNYVVTRVARSLNSIIYAVKEVNVT